MLLKVLLYGYCTGVRSSRRLEQNCSECLPYLLLVREDRPTYRTLCSARLECKVELEILWDELHKVAASCGMVHVGKLYVDSSKFQADVSRDSVLGAKHYESIRQGLAKILAEAESIDAREEGEGESLQNRTGVEVNQMREVIRRISKGTASDVSLSPKLKKNALKAVQILEDAERQKLSHVSLTDPDARMMGLGSSKRIGMGHSFEAVTDAGDLVVGQTHNISTDNSRLPVLVEEARKVLATPVQQVTADSGYYAGGVIHELLEQGINTVVPDTVTVGNMRRPSTETQEPKAPPILFERNEDKDSYVCPEGKTLKLTKRYERGGQKFVTYVAKTSCLDCPLAKTCLQSPKATKRHLSIGEYKQELLEYLKRFEEPDVRSEYYARGPAIETVFGFIRSVLGYNRWSLRGAEKVQIEGSLFKLAYRIRKIHIARSKMSLA